MWQALGEFVERPTGFFFCFLRKWRPWKSSKCICAFVLLVVNIWPSSCGLWPSKWILVNGDAACGPADCFIDCRSNGLNHELALTKARAIFECSLCQGMGFHESYPITNIAKAICSVWDAYQLASFFFFSVAANSALNYGSLSFLSITISLFLANSVIDPNPSKSSLSSASSSACRAIF